MENIIFCIEWANIEFDFTIFDFLNGEYLFSEIIKTCIPVKCIFWVINLIFILEIGQLIAQNPF